MLKDSLEPRTFFAAGGIGFVAAVAILIVDLTAGGLLRIQAKFGVGLAPFSVTASVRQQRRDK